MSRKQKLKARDRITQKMSRDGVIERNESIGEDIRVSKREVAQDLRGGKTDSGTSYQLDKRPGDKQIKKHKQHRPAEQVKDAEKPVATDVQQQFEGIVHDKQPDIPSNDVQSEIVERDVIRQEQPIQVSKPTSVNNRYIPLQSPLAKAKPLHTAGDTPTVTEQTPSSAPQTEKPIDAPRSSLNHNDDGKLQFKHDNKTVPDGQRRQKPPQKYKPEITEQSDSTNIPDGLPPTERTLDTAQSPETSDTPPSALKHDAPDNLHFEQHSTEVKPPGRRPVNQPKSKSIPNQAEKQTTDGILTPVTAPPFIIPKTGTAEITAEQSKPLQTNEIADTSLNSDKADSPLKFDKSDKLHFEPTTEKAPLPIKPKHKPAQNQATQPVTETKPTDAPNSEKPKEAPVTSDEPQKSPHTSDTSGISDTPQHNNSGADSPLHSEKSDAPLHTDKSEAPLKPDKPGKLKFSEDETPTPPKRSEVKQQKRYGKAQKQTDKAVKKLDTAKSKLPSKKRLRSERVFNEETGKSKRKLYFESEVKSQGEHIKGALPLRPVKAAGNSALAFGHRKMFQVERENVATEAAHKIEMSAEGGVRMALHHVKTAPYRKVQKLERTVRKKSIKAAYQKALAENPKLKSNLFSRAFQKRKIKKDYAKAAREAQKTAKRAKQAGSVVSKASKALAGVVKRHPIATAVIVLILLLLFCLMSLIGAFGSAGTGGLGAILSASYLAEDVDIDNAEVAYTEWEVDLQQQIANTESTHTGYDEYRYNIGDISHNPYELMAYLTVKYQNFTYDAIESDLQAVFGEQYSLAFTPSTETRYADPDDANEDGDYEPYDWSVLTVSLTARSFSDVAASHLSGDQLAHYALLLQTKGSRQYVGNPFGTTDWLSYVTSYYGYRIHPISGIKDLHRGVDIGFPAGTQILSAQSGTVTFAGYSGDYGNVVIIESADGFVTKYAHCETLLVSQGQSVNMGDVIATVGSTGNSTGPHLHFEVLKNGIYLNPAFFADSGSFNLTPNYGYAGAPMGDGSYAALIAEAEKYLNFPYVWGGSNPSTSFDCSGFVSWVLTQSGVKNTGRLGAQGLYNICNPVSPAEAQPGDLIFFTGTYSAPLPVTHVGIYVGTDATRRPRMLHCGNPIQYTYIDTAYWQNHFYAFGRISSD